MHATTFLSLKPYSEVQSIYTSATGLLGIAKIYILYILQNKVDKMPHAVLYLLQQSFLKIRK
jgi:hypothetical protein